MRFSYLLFLKYPIIINPRSYINLRNRVTTIVMIYAALIISNAEYNVLYLTREELIFFLSRGFLSLPTDITERKIRKKSRC